VTIVSNQNLCPYTSLKEEDTPFVGIFSATKT